MNRQFQCCRAVIGLAFAAMFALAPTSAPAQEKQISVWWVKGFYKSEDDALYEAIRKFEARTGIKVDLSQYAVQDMIPKTVSALDAGTPPDVAYADVYDFQVAGKWAYDGFPLKQQTMHIEYWIDLLEAAGFKESDVPKNWKDYWSFWCDKAQPALRRKTGKRDYAIGMPMGVDSSDSFYSFLTFMDAYNVRLVDDDGKLTVDDPRVKQGLIGALTDYT